MNPSVPTRHCSRWQEEETHLSRKSRRTFSPAGRTAGGGRPTVLHEKRGLPLAFFWESVYETSLWCGQSKQCEFCGKKPQTGNYVSHSNIKTKRVFNPNLQNVRHQFANGEVRTVSVCTRCLRSGVVTKPVVRKAD